MGAGQNGGRMQTGVDRPVRDCTAENSTRWSARREATAITRTLVADSSGGAVQAAQPESHRHVNEMRTSSILEQEVEHTP